MNEVTINFRASDLSDCCQRGCMVDGRRVGVSGFRSLLGQRFGLPLSAHVKNVHFIIQTNKFITFSLKIFYIS